MRSRVVATVIVALLLVGAGASCSKKDSGASKDTTTTTESEKSTTTEGSDDSSSSDADVLDGLSGNVEDCAAASLLYGSMIGAAGAFMGGATEEQIKELDDNIAELQDSVPDDLKDDFQTVADAYKEWGQVFAGADASDFLDPDFQDQMEKASEKLESPEVQEASDNIEQYFADNCQG